MKSEIICISTEPLKDVLRLWNYEKLNECYFWTNTKIHVQMQEILNVEMSSKKKENIEGELRNPE